MSTNDVPGANPKNADVLAMGCWAEHEDGSLIFVESVEGGTVVYSIFDIAPKGKPRCLGRGKFMKIEPMMLHNQKCAEFYFGRNNG